MNDEQLTRYSRHILLPQIDIAGQEAICESKVLVLGVGGLGSPVAMYLAASGVGELILVDDDQVALSNLQRQIIYSHDQVGEEKVSAAQQTLHQLNPDIKVRTFTERPSEERLRELLSDCDLALDCSDNVSTRKLLNRVCFSKKIPLVFGAAIRFEGQLSVFDSASRGSGCYECLNYALGELNESCSENGVVSPLVGVIGSMQALEAVKILAGISSALRGRVALFDGLKQDWRYFKFQALSECEVCGEGRGKN